MLRFDSIRTNRHESFPLLSIRFTGSRFARYLENIASRVYTGWAENVVDSIRTNRHESFPLLSNRYTGSRFARYLEKIASRVYTGWAENVAIRLDSNESTRIVSPAVDSFPVLSEREFVFMYRRTV